MDYDYKKTLNEISNYLFKNKKSYELEINVLSYGNYCVEYRMENREKTYVLGFHARELSGCCGFYVVYETNIFSPRKTKELMHLALKFAIQYTKSELHSGALLYTINNLQKMEKEFFNNPDNHWKRVSEFINPNSDNRVYTYILEP